MSFIREPDAEPIPGYRLIEPLGSGGFGEVWKCEAPGGLFKAIKFVYGNLNSLDGDAAGAEQEHRALQRVKEVRHPFVLSMDRIEVVDGELVIVMELADKSLHDLFVECQTAGLVGVPRDDLLRFLRDAAEALDHMFEKHHLQHLDIKPRNLFLISDRVKVADFGLVKHLERQNSSGLLMGVTPLYAAPETFSGKISEHSDQYSLAIVYQELLTGRRPFNGKNVRQLAIQHLSEEPEVRVLPEAERAVVLRALAKEPAKRFPNCLAFVRALYTAWTPARSEVAGDQAAGPRPKTLSDTLEDIFLENRGDEAGESPRLLADRNEVSRLGLTVALPDTGALRPALIVGVGGFGRRALRELRCRFLDRFGDLDKVPLFRFLYADVDPEAVKNATRGAPEVAFAAHEVLHLPLQSATNYRRRNLDQLAEWLPREKLYAIPRALVTQGARALGRLAFADNYLRFLARLRRELQAATHPDALYQAVSQTGLALRDGAPRVYVIGAAAGGGSGLLTDLGFALRRLLRQMGHERPEVHALLFCGAPADPATPPAEQANLYATLTELHHFSDPGVPFAAQYSADGPRLVEAGPPYSSVYLLAPPLRSPQALRDAVCHLGGYLFHDLTTPLGAQLDRSRQDQPSDRTTWFRSFGTYAVWFPRGLLLQLAARQTLLRLLDLWQAPADGETPADLLADCRRVWDETGLHPAAVTARVEQAAQAAFEGGLEGALAGLQADLEQQAQQPQAAEDPVGWVRRAVPSVLDWVGLEPAGADTGRRLPTIGGDWHKGRLGKALAVAAPQLADKLDKQLAAAVTAALGRPGRRLAAAEQALGALSQLAAEAAAEHLAASQRHARQAEDSWERLEEALRACMSESGGFRLFAGRSTRRNVRGLIEQLTAFARHRFAEDLAAAGQQLFSVLCGRLAERLRDLGFTRQRLVALAGGLKAPPEVLEPPPYADVESTPSQSPLPSTESFWESIRRTSTVRIVLPEGEKDLERAAARFLASLRPGQWDDLDVVLQERVLAAQGGLHKVCSSNMDLLRGLAYPLLEQAAAYLGGQLPITDVAQVEETFPDAQGDLPRWVASYHGRAVPLVTGKDPARQADFLLLPASDAGKTLGEQAKGTIETLQLVRVPGQADLMFCREQGPLSPEDLRPVFSACRPAYEAAAAAPQSSPHARFDVVGWLPLDP